jgi:hypothetical protein
VIVRPNCVDWSTIDEHRLPVIASWSSRGFQSEPTTFETMFTRPAQIQTQKSALFGTRQPAADQETPSKTRATRSKKDDFWTKKSSSVRAPNYPSPTCKQAIIAKSKGFSKRDRDAFVDL